LNMTHEETVKLIEMPIDFVLEALKKLEAVYWLSTCRCTTKSAAPLTVYRTLPQTHPPRRRSFFFRSSSWLLEIVM
jgi:hypothetical protein